MTITGQFSTRSGHFRSNCGCVSVIRVPIERPFPACPMCLRATSWTPVEEIQGATTSRPQQPREARPK
jgi:hypothetical protein